MGLPTCGGDRSLIKGWINAAPRMGWVIEEEIGPISKRKLANIDEGIDDDWEINWKIHAKNSTFSLCVYHSKELAKNKDEVFYTLFWHDDDPKISCHAIFRILLAGGARYQFRDTCTDIWWLEGVGKVNVWARELKSLTTISESTLNVLQPAAGYEANPFYSKKLEFSLFDTDFQAYTGPAALPDAESPGEYVALKYRIARFGNKKKKQLEAINKIDSLLKKLRGQRLEFYIGLFGRKKIVEASIEKLSN